MIVCVISDPPPHPLMEWTKEGFGDRGGIRSLDDHDHYEPQTRLIGECKSWGMALLTILLCQLLGLVLLFPWSDWQRNKSVKNGNDMFKKITVARWIAGTKEQRVGELDNRILVISMSVATLPQRLHVDYKSKKMLYHLASFFQNILMKTISETSCGEQSNKCQSTI